MEANVLSISVFESLLPALANVLEVARRQDDTTTTLTQQTKQELLKAVRSRLSLGSFSQKIYIYSDDQTNNFKSNLAEAKRLVDSLPGGNLTLSEQDEVIELLEKLRDEKR